MSNHVMPFLFSFMPPTLPSPYFYFNANAKPGYSLLFKHIQYSQLLHSYFKHLIN